MTTVTASPIVGSGSEPAGFQLIVAGAASPPTPAYASNFTAGVDSWSGAGTGVSVTNDTATNPDSLHITGPGFGAAAVSGARVVTGLSVGAHYRFALRASRETGQIMLTVRENPGATIATTAWLQPSTSRTLLYVDFVATATSLVIETFVKMPYPATAGPSYRLDTVTVDPTNAWTGFHLTRTDANGTDVPVRNPNHLDTVGGGLTINDYEAALTGPVTYTATDGLGASGAVTTSVAPTHTNRATNPIGSGVPAATPWAGTGGTVAVSAGDALRLTLTTATATDLAQRLESPSTTGSDYFTIGEVPPGSAFRARVEARCSLAPIGATTITVQQVMSTSGTLGTANTSLVLSVTPQAGDVLLIHSRVSATPHAITSITGCGGAFVSALAQYAGPTGVSEWWKGTGMNATGTITVNMNNSRNGILRAWLIRGLTSSVISRAAVNTSGSVTTLTGTPVSIASGQIAISAAHVVSQNTMTFPNPPVPATGWTTGTLMAPITAGSTNTAYRIEAGTSPVSHNTTATFAASQAWIENVVLGSVVTPSTPVPILKTRLTFADSAGAPISSHDSPLVTVNSSVYSELLVDEPVPSGAERVRVQVGLAGTVARSVGDWIDVRRAMVGDPATWFDGDTVDDPALQEEYAWAGAPDASPSLAISTAPLADVPPSLTIPTTALLTSNLDPPEFAPLTMLTVYDETSQSNGTVHVVIGRSDKISNPGTLLDRAGSVDLFCLDYDDAAAVRDLLKDARVAMLRQSTFLGFDLYFVARSVNLRPDPADTTPRRWIAAVTYDEVPRP